MYRRDRKKIIGEKRIKNMNFCFVILHYKTDEDTIQCVESIDRLNTVSNVVIVDNFSNNGSIEKLKILYKNKNNIHIICNKQNLGFAEGNNIGYEYAKKVLNADFIAVINNDTIIDTINLINIVSDYFYEEKKYSIIGPDIVSLVDQGHQNPLDTKLLSLKKSYIEYARYSILLFLSKLGLYDILKREKKVLPVERKEKKIGEKENCMLHGAFMIFTPLFIEKEDICFRNGTFLYMEEAILYLYVVKNNMKTVFLPDIKVFHKEDSSTNSLFKVTKEKREFVFDNMKKSIKVYIKYLKKYGGSHE